MAPRTMNNLRFLIHTHQLSIQIYANAYNIRMVFINLTVYTKWVRCGNKTQHYYSVDLWCSRDENHILHIYVYGRDARHERNLYILC